MRAYRNGPLAVLTHRQRTVRTAVFKGTFDGKVVAVKVLTVEGGKDSDAHRMFFKEAHVLQRCNHK